MKKIFREINKIIKDFEDTQVPIPRFKMENIANLAINNNLLLSNETLSALYENKRNVAPLVKYLEPRLLNFFDAKKLLPPRGELLLKVRLLNLCVKVKKDKLVFEDSEVTPTKQFRDYDSLKTACKLYIWDSKLNKCASFNTLDEKDQKIRWDKNLDRLCNIANVPIDKPPGIGDDVDDDEGDEGDDETDKDDKDDKDEDDEEGDEDDEDGDEDDEESDKEEGDEESDKEEGDEESDKEEGDTEEGDEESKEDEKEEDENNEKETEEFTQDFPNYSNNDYRFIISTALFIFFIYLIYNRYKKL